MGTRGSTRSTGRARAFVEAGEARPRRPGALVVSLDFELHWGVRDWCQGEGTYRRSLLGAREAVPRILELFREFDVAATWATVGFLFATSKQELQSHWPAVRPRYRDSRLDPYQEPVGDDEADDPLHYAPSLIELIRATPGQEIASHTFSHYYCLEPGQDREAFEADMDSAIAIARRRGVDMSSLVFPRNQVNPDYLPLLAARGITCYRGSQEAWLYRPRPNGGESSTTRGLRLLDNYAPLAGACLSRWDDIVQPSGLCNISASRFLRPYLPWTALLEKPRIGRVCSAMRKAAISRDLFHLWWHPHNFGVNLAENLQALRAILSTFAALRSELGMASLSMRDVDRARCS